jgi:hypothetical protein
LKYDKFTFEEFQNSIIKILNQECWDSFISYGTTLCLHFGRKQIHYSKDIKHRIETGVFCFIILCSWRIETSNEIICTWQDNDGDDYSKIFSSAELFKGSKVIKIDLSMPSYDLTIEFSNGLILKVFCDYSIEYDEYGDLSSGNYSFIDHNVDYEIWRNDILSKFNTENNYPEN